MTIYKAVKLLGGRMMAPESNSEKITVNVEVTPPYISAYGANSRKNRLFTRPPCPGASQFSKHPGALWDI